MHLGLLITTETKHYIWSSSQALWNTVSYFGTSYFLPLFEMSEEDGSQISCMVWWVSLIVSDTENRIHKVLKQPNFNKNMATDVQRAVSSENGELFSHASLAL